MSSKRLFLSVSLLALFRGNDPAAAGCASFEKGIFEAEILACDPARLRVEEIVAQECYDAGATRIGLMPPEAVFPDVDPGRWTLAKHEMGTGDSLTRMVEWQADQMREKSTQAVVITARMLRLELYRPNASPVGNWQKVYPPWVTERLIEMPASACAELVGKRVLLDDASTCCDLLPAFDLSCYLRLPRVRLTEDQPVEARPGSLISVQPASQSDR